MFDGSFEEEIPPVALEAMRQLERNGVEGPLSDAPLLPSAPSQDDWILVDSPPSMAVMLSP